MPLPKNGARLPRLPRRPRTLGFSLLEILIVMAIIVLLMTMVLAGGAAYRRSAKRRACLAAFEHVKDAQAIFRSKMGYPILDSAAAGWQVRVAGGPPRPLTTMEYFCLMARQSPESYQHLQLMGDDVLVPSTEKSGAYYGTVKVYPTLADASGDTNVVYTLYDPANPAGAPAGTTFDAGNSAPLSTVIGPWVAAADWSPAQWSATPGFGATPATFQWRPHELDFRASTAIYTPAHAPVWYANDQATPPYLVLSEGILVSSPGPDGNWGTLTDPVARDPSRRDADAADNLYSNQRDQ